MEDRVSDVMNDQERKRFEITADGHTGFLAYSMDGADRINLRHTEVPPELEGRGFGGKLAKAALEYARSAGLRVTVTCPFVGSYVQRHPEYADLTR
jgi:uncharacterized protein